MTALRVISLDSLYQFEVLTVSLQGVIILPWLN